MAKRPVHYDVLLRIRRLQQDLNSQAFAEARQAVSLAQQQRAGLAEERTQLLLEAGDRAQHHFDPVTVRLYYRYERHLARIIDEKDAEIASLQQEAERKRVELEEAMKRRRVVEKLRERKLRAFLDEIARDDQKFSDESATNAAAIPRIREVNGKEYAP